MNVCCGGSVSDSVSAVCELVCECVCAYVSVCVHVCVRVCVCICICIQSSSCLTSTGTSTTCAHHPLRPTNFSCLHFDFDFVLKSVWSKNSQLTGNSVVLVLVLGISLTSSVTAQNSNCAANKLPACDKCSAGKFSAPSTLQQHLLNMPASAVVLALVRENPPKYASVSTRSSASVGSTIKPSWSPTADGGIGIVAFSRSSSQFLNAGARTLGLASRGVYTCGGVYVLVCKREGERKRAGERGVIGTITTTT